MSMGETIPIPLGAIDMVGCGISTCGSDKTVFVAVLDGGNPVYDTTDLPSIERNPESPVVKRYVFVSRMLGGGISPHWSGISGAGVVVGGGVAIASTGGIQVPLTPRMAACLMELESASVNTI